MKKTDTHERDKSADALEQVERPIGANANAPAYGSDVVADTLRALDIPYIALNPGSSYRGLHDSLVNYLGNTQPQMLLCLHEAAAIHIAQGWAKVTGRAMAAAVHSNVGLMNGSMAIYNAWCDRKPMLIFGATGPVDAAKRRPGIDWIHTSADQGGLIRQFVKWDAQPASALAAREAILRAAWLTNTTPCAPVYVNLDAEMQEEVLSAPPPAIDYARYLPEAPSAAPREAIEKAAVLLKGAKSPIIFAGRSPRTMEAWNARIALVERLNARVVTDLKLGATFPTEHPLYAGAPRTKGGTTLEAMRNADVILSLDWVDIVGALQSAGVPESTKVIHVSLDHRLHNGWSMDHQAFPPVDLFLAGTPEVVVPDLIAALGPGKSAAPSAPPRPAKTPAPARDPLNNEQIALALRHALGNRPVTLAYTPISWGEDWWPFRHPLDFTGGSGGGGIGCGPGASVGVALAVKDLKGKDDPTGKDGGRMAVAVGGDGDFMMGCTAIWTAAHYRIPLLYVVANNRSFFNDEVHQEKVAEKRKRPVENRWIGMRLDDPSVDIAAMARAQGAQGFGPITRAEDLGPALEKAIKIVENGGVAVVDVHTELGYMATMMKG